MYAPGCRGSPLGLFAVSVLTANEADEPNPARPDNFNPVRARLIVNCFIFVL